MNLLAKTAGELQYLLLTSVILFIRILPYRAAILLGRFFGILAWLCLPLHRRIAQLQIHTALGNVNEKILSLQVFMSQGDIFIDTVKFAYMDEDELKRHIVIEGRENIETAIDSDRGVLMFTGHMNWEILGHIPRLLGFGFSIMGDVMKNPRIQSIVEEMRSRCGFTLLPPKGGMVALLTDELLSGGTIGIISDQRGRRENKVFCNIFGLPAPTSPAPALIALRGDALVQPVSAIKHAGTYTFTFHKTVDARDFGDDFKQIEKLSESWQSQAVQSLSDFMQTFISSTAKTCPAQYFWVHSRWLRRSDMKRIFKSGADFIDSVRIQAEHYLHEG
ncbi:MAG TPA: lysophospholipid acyltransferase family protein [Deltaproteobacteria bacterium]|nr:lysophospholipid acyltransferase family protein [Deltaproteobacteria bacterium]HPJ92891.1 lysophospholipid acyltransferase family protein [Deltaproteobacteria bacterium]HPR51058.1 lysophospholipid acyltransferase family protein [Deltaproteobacteria bacterium]